MSRNLQAELPDEVEERAKSIKEDNPDMDKSTAIAIARDQLNMAEQYDSISLEEDPCEDGWVMVGTKQKDGQTVPNCVPEEDADPANLESNDCPEGRIKIGDECVPVEEVDTAVNVLSEPHDKRVMSTASPLDTQPIEREELSNGTVAYRNIKLLDEGVWTDESSKTPTLYDERTFENLSIESPEGMDGPPVNVAHDLDSNGEPNEASVGGYIDPDSVDTDGKALFGDIVLDTDDPAGAYLDENLMSSLESNGEVGFSPSVELMPTELEAADHPQAEQHVIEAELTGTALVRDPASKSVDFAHETRNRQIAMGLEGQTAKRLERKDVDMSERTLQDVEELMGMIGGIYDADARDSILEGLQAEGIVGDDEYDTAAGIVDNVLDARNEEVRENLEEMGLADAELEEEDYDDEEEEDMGMHGMGEEEEDAEMAENMDMGEVVSMVQAVRERLDEIEEEHDALMQASEMEAELSEATEELRQDLAAAESVKELKDAKDDLEKRLSEVESTTKELAEEPEEPRTMADSGTTSGSSDDGVISFVDDQDPY